MTEKEKMLAGEVYSAVDPELIGELMATRRGGEWLRAARLDLKSSRIEY